MRGQYFVIFRGTADIFGLQVKIRGQRTPFSLAATVTSANLARLQGMKAQWLQFPGLAQGIVQAAGRDQRPCHGL